jgi:prephenate dehydratase/chorismate mutase
MDLEQTRKRIDSLDREIVKLLNERMEVAIGTRNLKGGEVSDTAREEFVLSEVRKHSKHLIRPEFSEKLYQEIISESKRLQEKRLPLIGFQGEHGAYSEAAAKKYNPILVPMPCREFPEVFEGVRSGKLDFGIVPVENSLEGAVTQVNDLLVETDLKIVGEIVLPVHHDLLALPHTEPSEIRVVYSHPQALAQCRGFISRNKLEPRPYYDTAGAAKMLSHERLASSAVIANRLCAELYNLESIKENIEDHGTNSTRFVVLAKEGAAAGQGDKCSLALSTKHEAGALFLVLKVLSEAGINMTRIESRPLRGARDQYAFLIDFEGSEADPKIKAALDKIAQAAPMYKFLGCYRGALK